MVRKRTLGGFIGYSSGRNSSSLKIPPGVSWEPQDQLTLIRGRLGAGNRHVKVAQVVVVGSGGDARGRVGHEALGFLRDQCDMGDGEGRESGSNGERANTKSIRKVWLAR